MAWKGLWGCYIHIPKTSGLWTKRVLNQLGHGEREGMTHQLPRVWAFPKYFTVVREPADWLRSVFCNRRQSRWQEHPEKCPWADFTKIVMPYRTDDFEGFIDRVTSKIPGVVGWLYGCYIPPKVMPIRYGKEQVLYLEDLGCHPEREMPVNVSDNKPDITPRMQRAVFGAEYSTYLNYGWTSTGKDSEIIKPYRFWT